MPKREGFGGFRERAPARRYTSKKFLEKTLSGRYQMQDILGCTCWSTMVRGKDLETGNDIMVKCYDPLNKVRGILGRHRNEIHTLERLNHEGIVGTYPSFEVGGYPCLVMEFLPEECEKYFKDSGINAEVFCQRVMDYMEELGSTVQYMVSEKVTHMDIKPSNLRLDENGKLKLTDFNFSMDRKNPDDVAELKGTIVGTTPFIPPEGQDGNLPTETYEVYSVGLHGLMFLYNFHCNPDVRIIRPTFMKETEAATMMSISEGLTSLMMLGHLRGKCPDGIVDFLADSTEVDPKRRLNPDEMMERIKDVKTKI